MPLIEPKSTCKEFARLNFAAQNFYWTLRTHLDPMGRHLADPDILLSTLFPLKRSHVRRADISRWLAECQKAGVLRCYADTKGRSCVEVKDGVQRMKNQSSKLEGFDGGQASLLLEGDAHPPPKPKPKHPSTPNRKEWKGIEEKKSGERDVAAPLAPKGTTHGELNANGGSPSPLEALRTRLNAVYKRKVEDRWSHAEEHELLEISRRQNWAAELEHILTYRKLVLAREEIRFFPNSINSLLSKWTETLDKARVQCPAPKVLAPPSTINHQLKPKAVTAEEIRSSIEYLQESFPKSPSLPDLLARYKAMTGEDLSNR